MRKVVIILPVLLFALIGTTQWGSLTGQFLATPNTQPRVVDNVQSVPATSPTEFVKPLSFTLSPRTPWHFTLLGPVSDPYAPEALVALSCTQSLDVFVISDADFAAWTEQGTPPQRQFARTGFAFTETIPLLASSYLVVEGGEFPLNDRADCTGSITYHQV